MRAAETVGRGVTGERLPAGEVPADSPGRRPRVRCQPILRGAGYTSGDRAKGEAGARLRMGILPGGCDNLLR